MAASISASQEVCAEGDNNNNEEVAGKTAPRASWGKRDGISGPEVSLVLVPCSDLAAVCLAETVAAAANSSSETAAAPRNNIPSASTVINLISLSRLQSNRTYTLVLLIYMKQRKKSKILLFPTTKGL